jgi:hypothetical protein
VSLNGNAPSAGSIVLLASSDPSLLVLSPSVTIAGDQKSAQFAFATKGVASNTVVAIGADLGGNTKATTVTLLPAVLLSVTATPDVVVGGGHSYGRVALNGFAPVGGATVALSSSNPAVLTVPATMVVPANTSVATYMYKTVQVPANTLVTITASYNGLSKTTLVIVTPPS